MKKSHFILTVILLIGGLLFFGCNENREKDAQVAIQQAKQDLKDAQAEYEKEWKEFKSDAEIRINANAKIIEEYKIKIKTASKKFKLKYEKEVAVLEQKNIELRKKISEYKYEGKDKWEEFKQSFNEDMEIVGKALNDLFAKK
jgi:hypothetical protein